MILGNLFQDIGAQAQERLLSLSSEEFFPHDTILVKAGQEFPLFLYIVQQGSHVEIHQLHDGRIQLLTRLEPGEPCGEVAFVERGPRSASILVKSNSKLLKISFDVLDKWLREDVDRKAKFYENLSKILVRRFVKY